MQSQDGPAAVGQLERAIAEINLRNIRYVLARRDFSP
jgi:hypothetical protein